jgi:hypothetical protein
LDSDYDIGPWQESGPVRCCSFAFPAAAASDRTFASATEQDAAPTAMGEVAEQAGIEERAKATKALIKYLC